MSAITAKASRKMKKYAVLTREPRCFLGSFDFSWEQRKAIDIADYSKGNGYSKGDLTDAGTPIILYGRLYTKYQFAISEVDTFAFPRNGAVYSQGNEVIVPASGETAEDIARASAVEKSGVLLGGDLNILRPFDFINPLFLALAISNGEPQKELAKKAQGKSVVHIHNTDIQEVTIAYPSRTEQDRIVSVFRQLDNLITLHQRKCVFLFGFFQAFISMIFTASTFSWEQRKVSELFRVTRGYVLAATQTETTKTDEKPYPVYSSQTKDKGLMGYYKDYLYEDAITWTTDGANAGTVNYRAGKFYCTNVCGVLLSNEVKANQMIAEALNSVAKGYVSYVGNPKLMNNVMADIVIQIPTQAEEREQLSSFFAKLDNLITLHQRECIAFTARAGRLILTANKKRNTSSWEQRKLGEIGSVSMCRRIFKEQTSETGDIPFYKIGTFGADPDAFISRELFEEYKSKYPYPQKGDILISASGSIGRTVEFAGNNEYFQDSNIVWLNHDERLSNPFLKCFYSVVKWAGIEGSTIKRLYNDNILNTVICMPSVPEQKCIGLFFENLDNLITLHQRKPFLMKWRTSDANRNQTNRLVL